MDGRSGDRGPLRSGQRTILIVDDDPAVTETFARMLQLEGYRVVTALDAETGLQEWRTHAPDAVLLDLRMPILDGLAFIQQLRASENGCRTPIAIVTGDYFPGEELTRELAELGAAMYFKPIWIEDLLEITERLLTTLGAPPPNPRARSRHGDP